MDRHGPAAITLPSIRDQVWTRWGYACNQDYQPLMLADPGRFGADLYAMPSWALLEVLLGDKMAAEPAPAGDEQPSSRPPSRPPILDNPEAWQTALRSPCQRPALVLATRMKRAAPHWKREYAPKNPVALNGVVDHLAKSGIQGRVARLLGEDLVRQHTFNCNLPDTFKWSAFKDQLEAVATRARASHQALSEALEACDEEVISAISSEWDARGDRLSFQVLGSEEPGVKIRQDALVWVANLREASESALRMAPRCAAGSITALGDSDWGAARRWLVLNAQALLRCLGLKAGNGELGPLARFIGQVDLASRKPEDAHQRQEAMGMDRVPPRWASLLVEEMRPQSGQR